METGREVDEDGAPDLTCIVVVRVGRVETVVGVRTVVACCPSTGRLESRLVGISIIEIVGSQR